MTRSKGFTLIELLVVISIITLMIGILLPALGSARVVASKLKNNTNVSGITKNAILYADSHNEDFPKLNVGNTSCDSVVCRMQELLEEQDLDPKLLVNPRDTGVVRDQDQVLVCTVFAANNCEISYAVLAHHNVEYKNNTNASAPMIADRPVNASSDDRSAWKTNIWEGSVAWGDTHVSFQTGDGSVNGSGRKMLTRIGGVVTSNDDIFDAGTPSLLCVPSGSC